MRRGGKEKGLEAATVALVLGPQVSSCTLTSSTWGLPREGTVTPSVVLHKLLVMAPRARQHGVDSVILQRKVYFILECIMRILFIYFDVHLSISVRLRLLL